MRARLEDDLVKRFGVVPTPIAASLRAGILSGVPEQEIQAAQRLMIHNPEDDRLKEIFLRDEMLRAEAIGEYVVSLTPPHICARVRCRAGLTFIFHNILFSDHESETHDQ